MKNKTNESESLTPEDQARQMEMVEQILAELKSETPEQAKDRNQKWFDMFFTMEEDKFWQYYNTGSHWVRQMAACVEMGRISGEEITSWFGGHNCGWPDLTKEFADSHCLTGFGLMADGISRRNAKKLLKALRTGVPCEWIALPPSRISKWRCLECGELVQFETNGLTLRYSPKAKPCPYPDGFKEFYTELFVPSGKLAIRDYFNEVDVAIERDGYDRSKQAVRHRSQDFAAKHKNFAAMGFCGNSCPSFFGSDNKEHFMVVNPVWDDNYADPKMIVSPMPDGDRVGNICTNVWEYSLVDADYLVARGGDLKDADNVIVVKPGVYRVSHHGHYINHDDFKSPRIFAELIWVRDC